MLKIKDDVNLKELEKYGFEYCGNTRWLTRYSYVSRCGTTTFRIWIYQDRKISINSPSSKVYSVLYDLIINGLVEKVED